MEKTRQEIIKEQEAIANDHIKKQDDLDLVQYLRDCEGQHFYSPVWGVIHLEEVRGGQLDPGIIIGGYDYLIPPNGQLNWNGACVIYPSKMHYVFYAPDAKAAWESWEKEMDMTDEELQEYYRIQAKRTDIRLSDVIKQRIQYYYDNEFWDTCMVSDPVKMTRYNRGRLAGIFQRFENIFEKQ